MALNSKVAFTIENCKKCICGACPVQMDSKCAEQQMPALKEAIKNNALKPESTPGLYCAGGAAACTDLKFKQTCICAGCPVFKNESLKGAKPPLFYCRDGAVLNS